MTLEQAETMPSFTRKTILSRQWKADHQRLSELISLTRNARKERLDGKITTEEQGNRLEDLVGYLFSCAPSIFAPKGNQESGISEKDNIVEIFGGLGGFMADWPPYLIVECKNWSSVVGKNEVEALIGKVRRAKAHVGLMWAQNVITGEDHTAAEGLTFSSLAENIVVLVFTNKSLTQLLTGENFIDLLEQEYRTRRFAL